MKDNRPFIGFRPLDKPLDASMDNVLASRLADALMNASLRPGGDSIDQGLALLKELNRHGFDVIIKAPNPGGMR